MPSPGPIVCFGEVLLRLAAPRGELLLQSPALQVAVGGAEANVAVALACAGVPAAVVSVLPDNALGIAARDTLRRHGVATQGIRFAPGRMGLYFLTPGAALRPSEVLYDRAGSSFAVSAPELIDWEAELRHASRFHLSGMTAALGSNAAAAALLAAQTAARLGVPLSFDGNHRARLWAAWDAHPPSLLRPLLAQAETAFIDHRDIALILERVPFEEHKGRDAEAAAEAFHAFPKLQRIASVRRQTDSADRYELVAQLWLRDGTSLRTAPRILHGVVDRVGAGDAFAAGILYGLWRGVDDRRVLDYGLVSTCLKHSIAGDASLASAADLEAFMNGGPDIRR